MGTEKTGFDRRKFVKTGLQVAGAAALGSRVAGGAETLTKEISNTGSIPARPFGSTGHTLPIFGFGGCGVVERWGIGYNAPVLPMEERIAMVRYGYDQGIRYFDTAREYSESEEVYGTALAEVRDDVFLATKIWAFKPEDVRKSVETSLEKLQMDSVDLMQMHGPIIENVDVPGCMKIHAEMVKLRDEGLYRYIGLTNHVAFERTLELIRTDGFDQVMLAYGYCNGFHQMLSNRNLEWRELCLAEAKERGMATVQMKAFNGWLYNHGAKRMVPDYDKAELEKLPAAALRWVLQEGRYDVYNLGITYPADIDANIAVFAGSSGVTAEDRKLLADFTGKVYEGPWAKSLKVV
jgi:aryl-alcohol dehydrogenase-like predicted oxidoreductase